MHPILRFCTYIEAFFNGSHSIYILPLFFTVVIVSGLVGISYHDLSNSCHEGRQTSASIPIAHMAIAITFYNINIPEPDQSNDNLTKCEAGPRQN